MRVDYYLYLSAVLFTIGAVGVLVRRNAIVVFMCVELMLNAVNLTLVTFARLNGNLDGQVIAFQGGNGTRSLRVAASATEGWNAASAPLSARPKGMRPTTWTASQTRRPPAA